MSTHRVWTIEELEVDGKIAHRQSVQTYHDVEGENWVWDRPNDRLTESEKVEWDRIMNLLANVNGEDLRHVVDANSLMDHCNGLSGLSGLSGMD